MVAWPSPSSRPSLLPLPQDIQCGFGVTLDEVRLPTGKTVIAIMSITAGGPAERVSEEALRCSAVSFSVTDCSLVATVNPSLLWLPCTGRAAECWRSYTLD